MAISSQRLSASSIVWVVNIIEDYLWCLSVLMKLTKLLLEIGSNPVVGSSKNIIWGFAMRDIAKSNFLLFPLLRTPAFILEYEDKYKVDFRNSV